MTTLKITCPAVKESVLVRCDLSQASAPIMVDWMAEGEDPSWDSTQYQCADARHTINGLAAIGRELLLDALGCDEETKTIYKVING